MEHSHLPSPELLDLLAEPLPVEPFLCGGIGSAAPLEEKLEDWRLGDEVLSFAWRKGELPMMLVLSPAYQGRPLPLSRQGSLGKNSSLRR